MKCGTCGTRNYKVGGNNPRCCGSCGSTLSVRWEGKRMVCPVCKRDHPTSTLYCTARGTLIASWEEEKRGWNEFLKRQEIKVPRWYFATWFCFAFVCSAAFLTYLIGMPPAVFSSPPTVTPLVLLACAGAIACFIAGLLRSGKRSELQRELWEKNRCRFESFDYVRDADVVSYLGLW